MGPGSPGQNLTDTRHMGTLRKLALTTAVLGTAGFVTTAALIGSGVHAATEAALREQPSDRVLALMSYVESTKHTLEERNRAVWALGQLGDARALPVLRKYFTEQKCDHDHLLCQHELKKAIRLCEGAANLTSSLWR